MTVVNDDLFLDTAMLVLLDVWLQQPWAFDDVHELWAEMPAVDDDVDGGSLLARARYALCQMHWGFGRHLLEELLIDARLLALVPTDGARALMAREREWMP